MWSSWGESAKASLTQALEKTGDAISKAATQAGQAAQPSQATLPERGPEEKEAKVPKDDDDSNKAAAAQSNNNDSSNRQQRQEQLLGNLQAGWTSVLRSTKESISKAQEAVEEQQARLQERINEARNVHYKRDPKLPLDVAALKDAQVVYLTDRLISMSHPAMASSSNGEITGERKLAAVGHLLQRRHQGRFLVWNISEVDYETRILDEQVLTFSFPGSPSPPLGLLMKLLMSMEAWLKADDRNVAVVHCLTGKGRTSTVLAAFLCWMGQAGFGDMHQALQYIAACKQLSTDQLTIPSQRRYASYFKNMLDGVRPSQPPLLLKRIVLSEAPRYAQGPPRNNSNNNKAGSDADDDDTTKNAGSESNDGNNDDDDDPTQRLGCAPYLQIFKAGELLHTAPASLHFQQSPDELPFCQVADGAISFHIDQVIQGDVLIRCRHLTSTKQRVSMFRAALHTGYVPPKVLRLKKSELDGACNDHERYPDDFFVDLILESVDAEQAASQLMSAAGEDDETEEENQQGTDSTDSSNKKTPVTATAYDSMLHRDSRFWDVIAARRQEHSTTAAAAVEESSPNDSDDKKKKKDPMWGPTIGRRRDFGNPVKSAQLATGKMATTPAQKTALETFSIGGELDFMPTEDEEEEEEAQKPPKKDSLMEALMGALSEDGGGQSKSAANQVDSDVEVVVFEEESAADGNETRSAVSSEAASLAEKLSIDGAATSDAAGAASDDEQNAVAALLAEANLDLDDDMDSILKQAAGGADLLDEDFLNLVDGDDEDLEDFENFLSK